MSLLGPATIPTIPGLQAALDAKAPTASPVFSGALTAAAGVIADPAPNLFTQTWNDAADPFTAFKVNVTDTASASGSNLVDLQIGGVSKFKVQKDGLVTFGSFNVGSGTIDGGGSLLIVNGGVGGRLYPGTVGGYLFADNNVTGEFFGQIGGTTAAFPALKRSGADLHVRLADDSAYAGIRVESFITGSGTIDGGGSLLLVNGGVGGRLYPGTVGGYLFTDNNVTGAFFGQIGGTTAAFPALKRSGADLQVRLADDSAYTFLRAKLQVETDAAPASATAAGVAGQIRWDANYIYVCTAANVWVRSALATW